MFWESFINGFILSVGLILAIGPQNTYIIKKGLAREHVLLVTTVCFISDSILIFMGAMGVAGIFATAVWLHKILVFMGIVFLSSLGMQAWRNAYTGNGLASNLKNPTLKKESAKTVIFTALGFSVLNPNALLDSFVLIGGVASHYAQIPIRLMFTLGAIAGSFIWFYALGFAANALSPMFQNPKAGRVLDTLIGVIMFSIAGSLFMHEAWPLFIGSKL